MIKRLVNRRLTLRASLLVRGCDLQLTLTQQERKHITQIYGEKEFDQQVTFVTVIMVIAINRCFIKMHSTIYTNNRNEVTPSH